MMKPLPNPGQVSPVAHYHILLATNSQLHGLGEYFFVKKSLFSSRNYQDDNRLPSNYKGVKESD